jgi:hypothetical protein
LKNQSGFVTANGLEVILNTINTYTNVSDLLNVTTAILELISAYLGTLFASPRSRFLSSSLPPFSPASIFTEPIGELRVKLLDVGVIATLMLAGRSVAADRVAQEQSLKAIFNLSFLAGICQTTQKTKKQKQKQKQKKLTSANRF